MYPNNPNHPSSLAWEEEAGKQGSYGPTLPGKQVRMHVSANCIPDRDRDAGNLNHLASGLSYSKTDHAFLEKKGDLEASDG
jgi:hypothetical protein